MGRRWHGTWGLEIAGDGSAPVGVGSSHIEFTHLQQLLILDVNSDNSRVPVGCSADSGPQVQYAIFVGAENGVGNKDRFGQIVVFNITRMDFMLRLETHITQGYRIPTEPLHCPCDHRPATRGF